MSNSTRSRESIEPRRWTREAIRSTYQLTLPDLLFRAQSVHREHHDQCAVRMCRLLSIKTGGCPEDCAYCPQSAHYSTGVKRQPLLNPEEVVLAAGKAKEEGATRFCMGAAWREVQQGKEFDSFLEMVRRVATLNLEVCCTLGMLIEERALRLKKAGLSEIIGTRT
jgi:biotin synthase